MAKGHRNRLRDLVEKVGLKNLSIYQQMEYILFYVVPRVNTTDIAHKLIDTYGTISGVMKVPVVELEKVPGLGHNSAMQLSHFCQIIELYNVDKACQFKKILSLGDITEFLLNLFKEKQEEWVYGIALDKNFNFISYKNFASGTEDNVNFNKFDVITFATTYKAKNIIICHNHPKSISYPSQNDNDTTKQLQVALGYVGVNLVDSVIVGIDGIYSYCNASKLLIDKTMVTDNILKYSERKFFDMLY
jgi:DNA repair protein RadC